MAGLTRKEELAHIVDGLAAKIHSTATGVWEVVQDSTSESISDAKEALADVKQNVAHLEHHLEELLHLTKAEEAKKEGATAN